MIPRLLGHAVDQAQGILSVGAEGAERALFWSAMTLLAVSVARGVFTLCQNYFSESVGHHVGYELRLAFYDKVQRLPYAYHDKVHTGDLITMGLLDLDGVRMFFSTGLVRVVLLSVLIGVLIIWSAWDIIRESLDILLEGAPRGIQLEKVSQALRQVEGVIDIHDLHIWSLSSADHALSCHALIEDMPPSASSVILERIQALLLQNFSICHATVQFEHIECCGAQEICSETASHSS